MIWIALGSAVLAFVVSLVVTRLSISLSHHLRLFDQPDARKVHAEATPRLGGLGVVVALFVVGVPVFAYLVDTSTESGWAVARSHLAIAIGALFVFGVGVIDDLWSVSSRLKLMTLLAASAVLCGSGSALQNLVYSDQVFVEFPWVSWVVTTLWITGIAVAFNFIDGLDGLAGGLALLACLVLSYFLLASNLFAAAVAPLALAGGIGGFLWFNQHPAKTFMGDGGSLTIGYLIGAMTVSANPSLGTMRAMVLPALALSVALVDTALTIFRRRYEQRRSMFSAERGHIHHRLLDQGFSHPQTVLLIHVVSVGAVAVGFFSLNFDAWATLGGLALVVPLLWGLFHAAGSMRTGDMVTAIRRKREIDRTSRRYRNCFEGLQLEFDEAQSFSQWWQTVCDAADRLQFAQVELPIISPVDGEKRTFRWVNSRDDFDEDGQKIDAKIPIPLPGSTRETASADVSVPVAASLESAGERLALFSRLMAENGHEALRRIYRSESVSASHCDDRLAPGEFGSLRVALVHDFFYTYAGAERVVEQIVNVFPHCAIFGLFDFLPEEERGFLRGKPVQTTFLQRLPFARTHHRAYLPLMPLAIEQLDVSGYDLVISSSYLAAKGVITGPDQLHVCYCHSPVRYGWDLQHQYLNEAGLGFGPKGMFARTILHYLRNWDARSSLGVDQFIANSNFVARRIEKVYRRASEVIYPPVDTDTFVPAPPSGGDRRGEFYLAASRLVSYKRMDVIVEAFSRTPDRRLVVIGDGPEIERLQRMAGPNVELLGHQQRDTLVDYMQRARAFVFAAEEDFGIVPVEAMACGTPVIAYRKGGVLESIAPGPAGVLFDHQSVESLLDAVSRFERSEAVDDIDRKAARQRAERFSTGQFVERLTDSVRMQVAAKWPERFAREAAPVADEPTAAGAVEPATEPDDDPSTVVDA